MSSLFMISMHGAQHLSGRTGRAALVALAALATACSSAAPNEAFAERGQDIIGGFHADATELDHTGALVGIDPTTNIPFGLCTATLIAPETVVTAKHCAVVLPAAELSGFTLAWAAGPRIEAPLELIPIAAAQTAPGDVGGFVQMGRDVATLHLDRPSSIQPATPALFTEDLLGASMVSIGYGVFGASGVANDQRRIGRETVAGSEGLAFELLLGSFESFVEWWFTGQLTPDDFLATLLPDDPIVADLRREFEVTQLYRQHEAVTGLAPTDTQTCFGDSGGPLARFSREGGWTTYGVVSGGLGSLRSACDFGSVYSTFGPESFEFLEEARAWVDPCGDVTAAGECSGSVARTCETNFNGDIRRLVEEDCGALGLACVSSADGTGCGTVPPPAEPEAPAPDAAREVIATVRNAFLPEVARNLSWGN